MIYPLADLFPAPAAIAKLTLVANVLPPDAVAWLRVPLTAVYIALLLLVAVYGLHRYWLVWLYYRHRPNIPRPGRRFDTLPRVTIQLPMYNEGAVAERIIDAACALDYPRHRLQVQVVDDSTDDCRLIAKRRVDYWRQRGIDIEYRPRTNRSGYKAGALEAATQHATGEFIAIFDADFVPHPNFLKRTIHHFSDDRVGMVQTRWDHLNREDTLLTRSQAIFLDGHFVIEHTARNRSERWINFNGTAGVWRRAAIESAGGWQHDTLTEDVDLSYRAQMKGWRFVFLQRVGCPAELPPEINAFKSQQHRWTKGSIQTAKKLLPQLLRSDASLGVKVEAFFHLTSPMVYLYMTGVALLFYPAFVINLQPFEDGTWAGTLWGLTLFAVGTASASVFYVASQTERKRSRWWTVLQLPVLMSIGIGIALNNARGVIEALIGHESPFVRTPKYNTTAGKRPTVAVPSIRCWMCMLELAMGAYTAYCAYLATQVPGTLLSLPFLVLFSLGYFYVGWTSLRGHMTGRRQIEPTLTPG